MFNNRCFPRFPGRLWSVMTGSEVSHDVMTQTGAGTLTRTSPGRQKTLRVRIITIILVESPTWHRCSDTTCSGGYCQVTPESEIVSRIGGQGRPGDRRPPGEDQGERREGGHNDSGQGSELDCSLQI